MNYGRFLLFSVLGGIFWVTVCITAGYKLAQVQFIRKHFELVVLVIIAISVLPMGIEFLRHRAEAKRGAAGGGVGSAAAAGPVAPVVTEEAGR